MPLPLHQTQAVSRLAQHLYDYLPGSGAREWRGHVSFSSVAREVGLAEYWEGGSKQPAITRLLERTLDQRPGRFQSLMLAIVREGQRYREKSGRPLLRRDIETLNRLIADIGFKFPELWSERYLSTLPYDNTETPLIEESPPSNTDTRVSLEDLKARLLALHVMSDRQVAGLALEGLLNDLFAFAELAPRSAFRIIGEQIDGSFVLDGQTYLLEAKWHADRVGEDDLLVLYGKVTAKSAFTRGLFVSLSGFTKPGLDAFTRGKQPNSVLMDGADLWQVLEARMGLPDLLRAKVRRLAEEGSVFVPARELFG